MRDTRCESKQNKFIRTREDWYPSFRPSQRPNNPDYHNPLPFTALRVSMTQLFVSDTHPDSVWRVCVWGADDFGMERDVATPVTAQRLFNAIQDFTTVADLKRMGFRNA